MDLVFDNNLISTKEAGRVSGYSSDYLALLVRSGKIEGTRIGHNWLLNRESLAAFLDQHVRAQTSRAETLARIRSDEYRAAQIAAATLPLPHTERTLRPSSALASSPAIPTASRLLRAGAAIASVLVVLAGMGGSQIPISPALSASVQTALDEVAAGSRDLALTLFTATTERFVRASDITGAGQQAASVLVARASEEITNPIFAYPNLAPFVMNVPENDAATLAAASAAATLTAAHATFTRAHARAAVANVSLAGAARASAAGYLALGSAGYAGIRELQNAYLALLRAAGGRALALGAATRDVARALPSAGYQAGVALGRVEVLGTRAAIDADVSLAYACARGGPLVSHAVFSFVFTSGGTLMLATASAERGAFVAFGSITGWPAEHAPGLTASIWNTEYRLATRFTDASYAVSDRYLAIILGTGSAAYAGTHQTLAYLAAGPRALERSRLYETATALLGFGTPPYGTR